MSAVRCKAARAAAVLLCAGLLAGCAAPVSESAVEPTATPEATAPVDPALSAARQQAQDYLDAVNLGLLANRAAEYWEAPMQADTEHYAVARAGMAGVVDPNDDPDGAAALEFTDDSGEAYRARVDRGEAVLVKVSFYVEYQPEWYYLGPQYEDGTNSVYILTPVDENEACIPLTGWHRTTEGTNIPELSDEARELRINEYQHRMLVHQCRALAAAGLTDFASPADWTDEETARYLTARGADFGIVHPDPTSANMVMTIDFTTEDDWSSNVRFFPADWTAPEAVTLPDTPDYTWTYESDGKTITATGTAESGEGVCYTFTVYNGSDLKWDARTVCTGGAQKNP